MLRVLKELLFLSMPSELLTNFCLGFQFKPTPEYWKLKLVRDYPAIPLIPQLSPKDHYRRCCRFNFSTRTPILHSIEDITPGHISYNVDLQLKYSDALKSRIRDILQRNRLRKYDIILLSNACRYFTCNNEQTRQFYISFRGLHGINPYCIINDVPRDFFTRTGLAELQHRFDIGDTFYRDQILNNVVPRKWDGLSTSYYTAQFIDFRGMSHVFVSHEDPCRLITADVRYIRVTTNPEMVWNSHVVYNFDDLVNPLFLLGVDGSAGWKPPTIILKDL